MGCLQTVAGLSATANLLIATVLTQQYLEFGTDFAQRMQEGASAAMLFKSNGDCPLMLRVTWKA